jgi:hypothetical protein
MSNVPAPLLVIICRLKASHLLLLQMPYKFKPIRTAFHLGASSENF